MTKEQVAKLTDEQVITYFAIHSDEAQNHMRELFKRVLAMLRARQMMKEKEAVDEQ